MGRNGYCLTVYRLMRLHSLLTRVVNGFLQLAVCVVSTNLLVLTGCLQLKRT